MPSPTEPILLSELDLLKPLPPELWPNIDHIQTEDGAPVDNVFSEKQMRLLTESLYSSWKPDFPFVAFANVGMFYGVDLPALVPDVLLSLKVRLPEDLRPKLNRSYFVWKYGKPPEVTIEIVSNKKGREDTEKLGLYAEARVSTYFIYDPDHFLSDTPLRGYQLFRNELVPIDSDRFEVPGAGLRLTLWHGRYEDIDATWLRWIDADGNLIATGAEKAEMETQRAEAEAERAEAESQRADWEFQRAEAESQRAETESQRAETESQRAETESQRAETESQQAMVAKQENERLLKLLREHGIDPR